MAHKRRPKTIHFASLAESLEEQNKQAILLAQAVRTIAQAMPDAAEASLRNKLASELLREVEAFEASMWPIAR